MEYQYEVRAREVFYQSFHVRPVSITVGGERLNANDWEAFGVQLSQMARRPRRFVLRYTVDWERAGGRSELPLGYPHRPGEDFYPIRSNVRVLSTFHARGRTVGEVDPAGVVG